MLSDGSINSRVQSITCRGHLHYHIHSKVSAASKLTVSYEIIQFLHANSLFKKKHNQNIIVNLTTTPHTNEIVSIYVKDKMYEQKISIVMS